MSRPHRKRPDLRHGLSYTPEYRAWQTMRLRCTEPTNPAYADYGGRGITVCERWLNSPQNFMADMGPKPSPKHELDRINNDAGYSPENCRWVTREINDRNRRNNTRVTFRSVTLTLTEWALLTGISLGAISKRLAAGWTVERTLTTPMGNTGPKRDAQQASTVVGQAIS